jgi:hypothetical protein
MADDAEADEESEPYADDGDSMARREASDAL